jgi:hypothetical protein
MLQSGDSRESPQTLEEGRESPPRYEEALRKAYKGHGSAGFSVAAILKVRRISFSLPFQTLRQFQLSPHAVSSMPALMLCTPSGGASHVLPPI